MLKKEARDDLEKRFNHHAPINADAGNAFGMVRSELKRSAELIAQLCPDGREKSLALTKLEETMFFANAAIARNQDDGVARYLALPRIADE